jgi:predicted Zn-dependent peptidase
MPDSIVEAPTGIRRTTLANGIRIASERMTHVRSVSVGVWVGVGSRRETPGQNGICHFIEHMLFKGTEHRSAEQIARSVDSIGGNLDAFTAKELVSFNTKVLDEHLPIAFDVLADLVLNPLFNPDDIQKEKGVILEELKMEQDDPEYLVHEIFSSNFWTGHALGMSILGTKDSIASFDRGMVEDFWRRNYVPANIVVTAAGNLEHERLCELVSKYFAALPRTDGAPPDVCPATNAALTIRNKRSLEQVHVCLGVPSYPVAHEKRYACYVLNVMLGGGMSSRLFQKIRERLGLAYAVYSELSLYHDTGCLLVSAGTSLKTLRRVIECTLEEFRALKSEQVPADELRRAKDHLKGSLMLSLESTSSRMANLARQELYFGRFFGLDEMLEGIEKVSAEDVVTLARELFDPDRIALTVLGNLGRMKIRRQDLAC